MTLSEGDWLKYIEDNDLFLDKSTFSKLPAGRSYKVAKIDYVFFLAVEYAKRYEIKVPGVYKPVDLYSKYPCFMDKFENRVYVDKIFVMNEDGRTASERQVPYFTVKLNENGDDFGKYNLYASEPGEVLCNGSGDGFSRWVLWENLSLLPDVFICEEFDENTTCNCGVPTIFQ
jgi:hypothetical protein